MKFKLTGNHTLLEMATVGTFDDMTVMVYTNDPGKIPHFHILDSNTLGQDFNCCIRIDKAEYFPHQGKEDKLNSKDKKDLVKFLMDYSKVKRFSNFTNWEVLLALWNMNNSDIELDEDMETPNYFELN